MANVRCLQKLFRLQKFVLPLTQHCGHNAHFHTVKPSHPQTQSRVWTRNYAKDTSKSGDGATAQTGVDEFRSREEQRERERDAAEIKQQEETKEHDTQDEEEQTAKRAKVDEVRNKILDAALQHVPQHGWTRNAIVQGAEECGYPSAVHGMFPEGGFALVSHFNGRCNAQLLKHLQGETDNGQREIENPLDFLVQAVRHRLEMIVPYKQQWPQAMALIAQPQHASTALAQVLTLVDDICYYSGDRSVDFGWYTRRIGLATILKMTELYMLQDTSPSHTNTWEFLKNRMDEAVQLQMMLAQTEGMTHTFQRSFNSAFITARNILGLGYNRN
ncbi:ubiquinone biosynthesis protein COQ9, mitochondrial isoform X2 [Scaptodrosophila lebanonensis]|uniref:Ubiquinone biosynthesis protein n=1 Tax=Drosophila lebanonensis TaxID=7225 RepID=A0A6J2UCA9_DROLE|nr:ubiquinone biosynthesis protein COQ9, mitochondrial isoform X2 [Scaptodrosophila lebanonensis]